MKKQPKKNSSKTQPRAKNPKPAHVREIPVPITTTPGAFSMASEDAELDNPLTQWMVPSTDSHGHSAKLFTRCPPQFKHQLAAVLQKRRYPWDTEADAVRVAVFRLLQDIAKDMKDPTFTSDQARLNALVEESPRSMEYAHFEDTLSRITWTLDDLTKRNARPMARKMYLNVLEQVKLFEEEYWRTRYLETLEKFKELAK